MAKHIVYFASDFDGAPTRIVTQVFGEIVEVESDDETIVVQAPHRDVVIPRESLLEVSDTAMSDMELNEVFRSLRENGGTR